MTNDRIIITGSDAKYFDLAQGCIQSIRATPDGQRIALGFFDLGCTPDQLAWLRTKADIIRQPEWDFTFNGREKLPGYFKGLLARPFLRRYFPGHEVYLWIDADAWVQDWAAVELFLQGALARRGLAIVPELDRGSCLPYGKLPESWATTEKWYAAVVDPATAKRLSSYPLLNAGVFALHRVAPHWEVWGDIVAQALARSCNLLTDQMALNVAVYERRLFPHTELLPAWCNWTCHFGLPSWHEQRACLVEPYLPHTAIGIMHLTWQKHKQASLATTTRNKIEVQLRYPGRPVEAARRAVCAAVSAEGCQNPVV